MMKRYLSVFATLFALIFFTVMALTALAGTAQPSETGKNFSDGPSAARPQIERLPLIPSPLIH